MRDADGDRYPLHWAAARGEARCAELLLGAGADASVKDAVGKTAAAVALALRQHATYALLASR